MHITGNCFCGAIAYEAELEPTRVAICHCRDCQITGGSAFRISAIVEPAKFRYTQGKPRYFDKVADSGAVRRMAFCDQCGTHLCSEPPDLTEPGGVISIRVATAKEFEQLKPVVEVYCASRVPWLQAQPGCVQFQRMPVNVSPV
jgi:hypothetical protein